MLFRSPGGPVVKNLPYNAGDAGSIPGQGTKIPRAAGQLIPCATTTELTCLKWRREKPHTATREKPVHRNKEPTCCN